MSQIDHGVGARSLVLDKYRNLNQGNSVLDADLLGFSEETLGGRTFELDVRRLGLSWVFPAGPLWAVLLLSRSGQMLITREASG